MVHPIIRITEILKVYLHCILRSDAMATFTQGPGESMQRSARARLEPVNKPSNVTKERICHLIQQQVNESGKLARQLCQQSGSQEVSSRKVLYMVVVDTSCFITPDTAEICQKDG